MLGSMFIGLSGMQAYSNALRQISNNITNLNSTGFKTADVSFADVFSDPSGSGNSVGYGVSLSESRLDFTQGELRQSDRDLDLAIDGDGFLVLLKDGEHAFARTGSFEIDADGFVVLSGTDYKLVVLDASGRPSPVSIDSYRTSPPAPTTTISFSDNLSSTATELNLSDIKVFDALGEADNWQIKFERAATDPAGEWSVTVTNGSGDEIGSQTLKFISGIIDPATTSLTFEDAARGRSAVLDFGGDVTSFSSGSVSTLRASEVDGHGIGEITTLRANDQGVLEIGYSNEQEQSLGSVAIAKIQKLQALEQLGGGLFTQRGSSSVDFLTSEHQLAGSVLSGRIESSNVDLSEQFGDLILVQRGYQASSQVVSVSNDMIQQLFGIRGQG